METEFKGPRSAAERARDTAGIVGSWMHEGYVLTPEAEAIHAQAQRGAITPEAAIAIFRERAQRLDASLSARSP